MIMSTTFLPVSGSVHSGMNLGSPFFDTCSITTMIFFTPATRAIAPPMPLIILPGLIQLAMSPFGAPPPGQGWGEMAAADQREAVRRGEIRGGRKLADRLLAGIDQVRIDLVLIRERPDSEHPVLGLESDLHPVGNVVGD